MKTGRARSFTFLLCNVGKGVGQDWKNIVGFSAGGDERGKVTP
jgi:hypothetical protein